MRNNNTILKTEFVSLAATKLKMSSYAALKSVPQEIGKAWVAKRVREDSSLLGEDGETALFANAEELYNWIMRG